MDKRPADRLEGRWPQVATGARTMACGHRNGSSDRGARHHDNADGRDELIVSFPEQVRAFDPKTGKELWVCDGLNPLIYSSPIYGDGVVVAMGGFLGTLVAVKPGGTGNVTATHRLWKRERNKNQLGTGVIHAGHFYVLDTPGIAECIEPKPGKLVWEKRVSGVGPKNESWSSMILSGDKILFSISPASTIVFASQSAV